MASPSGDEFHPSRTEGVNFPPRSPGCVDASAILWRLHRPGIDVGERWAEAAAAWDAQADGRSHPFNDWHAVMAHLGAGRTTGVERVVAALREGKGAPRPGAALLSRGLAPADRDGLPAYLEATNRRHAALSARHGFGALGTVEAPGYPRIIPMWRPAGQPQFRSWAACVRR